MTFYRIQLCSSACCYPVLTVIHQVEASYDHKSAYLKFCRLEMKKFQLQSLNHIQSQFLSKLKDLLFWSVFGDSIILCSVSKQTSCNKIDTNSEPEILKLKRNVLQRDSDSGALPAQPGSTLNTSLCLCLQFVEDERVQDVR